MSAWNDPFNRSRGATFEDRVAMALDVALDLSRDERPGHRKLGAAIRQRLNGEARSIDEALGIANAKHSHHTAQRIAKKLQSKG